MTPAEQAATIIELLEEISATLGMMHRMQRLENPKLVPTDYPKILKEDKS